MLKGNNIAKAAPKLLALLTTGFNFANILRAASSYKSVLLDFMYILTVWVCNFSAKRNWQKNCSLNAG